MSETRITNPGIVDRLDQDIVGFHQYGFSFERRSATDSPRDSSRDLCCGILRSSSLPLSSDAEQPPHLWVDIPFPLLAHTVGPFLRTLVRITDGFNSRLLRVVVNLDWAEIETNEEAAAKVAHHMHMMVRNSMGAALFLTSLSIQLPHGLSILQGREAMELNEHVNYLSIRLLEKASRNDATPTSDNKVPKDLGRRAPPVSVQNYLQQANGDAMISARIKVEAHSCAVSPRTRITK